MLSTIPRSSILKKILIIMFLSFFMVINTQISIAGKNQTGIKVLNSNDYVELNKDEYELIQLNIKEDGVYSIRTSGKNNVIVKIIDEKGNDIVPTYTEKDTNIFSMVKFSSGTQYYAEVKVEGNPKYENSKMWLVYVTGVAELKCPEGLEEVSYLQKILEEDQEIYYKFIPNETSIYSIKSRGNIDLSGYVYDKNGKMIAHSDSYKNINFKILKKLEKDESYYIRIASNEDGAIGNFAINLNQENREDRTLINLESNDEINVIQGFIKYEGEINYIKFICDYEGRFDFICTSDLNLVIDIFDSDGMQVGINSENNDGYSNITLNAKSNQEYTLKIYSDFDKTGMYRLKIINFKNMMKYAKPLIVGKNEGYSFEYIGQTDYFKFVSPEDGIFNFNVISDGGVNIELFNENGKLIASEQKGADIINPIIGSEVWKGQTIYLKVVCRTRKFLNNYDIEVNDFERSICDAIEIDCQEELDGKIEFYGQYVMYKFVPENDGIYRFQTLGKTDTYGELYDKNGNLLSENDDKEDVNFSILRKLKKDMVYFIKITHTNSKKTGSFRFTVDSMDNNKESPTSIELDAKMEGNIEYQGDKKYFKFIPEESGIYILNSKSKSNIDLSINIYDEEWNIINTGERVNEYDYKVIAKLNKQEIYFIEVSGEDELLDIGEFSFKITDFTKKEQNAKPVFVGGTYLGNLVVRGNEDFYKFIPEESGCYSIQGIGKTDTYLEIYDLNGKILAENDNGIDFNFYLTFNFSKNKEYVLKIKGAKENITGTYGFKINKLEDYEYGEIDQAVWIKPGCIKIGVLNKEGESQYYKFRVISKGEYFIDCYGTIDLNMEVYDEKGFPIQEVGEEIYKVNHMRVSLLDNKIYYLKVEGLFEEITGVYHLKIDKVSDMYNCDKYIAEGTIVEGNIEKNGQVNYYKFIPYKQDNYITMQIEGDEICIDAFDEQGKLLFNDAGIIGMNISAFDDNKIYYIKIRNRYPFSTGKYKLFVLSQKDIELYQIDFLSVS